MTQPNPYPTETPYIEQQLACRKKISLYTSCQHRHPNSHANTHSITSISHIRPARNPQRISSTDSTFSADSLDFRPTTRPNPLKTNYRPIPDPTQPNPTRGSTQPMDNSGLATANKSRVSVRVTKILARTGCVVDL